ncbi:MAG TPA: hypothetical protein VJT74_02665 [Pyrinomonadaceae bacterium]|nr:hypothetical protein [Pyrinomonadaceae bacterium]
MNDSQTKSSEMFRRVQGFGSEHAADFPASSLGGEKFAALGGVIDELEEQGTAQASGGSAAKTSTGAKRAARAELKRQMAAISETARALEFARPGVAASFRLPNVKTDQALLNAARANAEAATPLKQEFIRHELPATFLEDLNAAVDAFETALNSQNQSTGKRVTATAAIEAVIERGRQLVRELDAIVSNKYRRDTATLAAWESASRVERVPRKKKPPVTPPPTT